MTFKRCDELLNLHQTLWICLISALVLVVLATVVAAVVNFMKNT